MKITIDLEGSVVNGKENITNFMNALEVFSESIPDGKVRVIDMEFIYNEDEDKRADWED